MAGISSSMNPLHLNCLNLALVTLLRSDGHFLGLSINIVSQRVVVMPHCGGMFIILYAIVGKDDSAS